MNRLHTPEVHAARRASHALKVANRDKFVVFTMRVSSSAYGWELRHFGSLDHHRSTVTYPSAELARQAGEAALAALNG